MCAIALQPASGLLHIEIIKAKNLNIHFKQFIETLIDSGIAVYPDKYECQI